MKYSVKLLVFVLFVQCNLLAKDAFSSFRADTLIQVSGIVTDKDTSEPISAQVFYEKLPYYDDMGIASAKKEDGTYKLFMVDKTKYMIEIKASGYDPIREEITVASTDGSTMNMNFELSPDAAHKKITLDNLIFARGKAIITQSSYQELDEFLVWLKARPSAVVQLEGHTDFQGNAQANTNLSQERVEAVRDYLAKRGIKKNRVKTKAFGGTQPLSRERTPEASAKNRRVEVRILQQ